MALTNLGGGEERRKGEEGRNDGERWWREVVDLHSLLRLLHDIYETARLLASVKQNTETGNQQNNPTSFKH